MAYNTQLKVPKGMNRNEYFEWKKMKVKELAKEGRKVAEIATKLGMSEEEMYTFLSRNFGGVRRLRAAVGYKPEEQNKEEVRKETEKVQNKEIKEVSKEQLEVTFNPIVKGYLSGLEKAKEQVFEAFKLQYVEEKNALLKELKDSLEVDKEELLETFRDELYKDIQEMFK